MYGFAKIANVMFDDLTSRHVRYLRPILPSKATGRVAEIYRQVQRDFQLAPATPRSAETGTEARANSSIRRLVSP